LLPLETPSEKVYPAASHGECRSTNAMIIRIKNLRLRAVIGIFDWERNHPQDVVINATIQFDGSKAAHSDKIEETVDYKEITKGIIQLVEASHFFLLEKLANEILTLILKNPKVHEARVEVDKPLALRYSDSVSVEVSGTR